MSIDFGTDIYEEPIVSKSFLPEDSGELSLRPHTLREYIGQQKAKENLSVFIEAARRRTEPLDHVLLHGPPGLGKTTLAGIIAAEPLRQLVRHGIFHNIRAVLSDGVQIGDYPHLGLCGGILRQSRGAALGFAGAKANSRRKQ